MRSVFIILMLSLSLPVTAQNVPQNFTIEGRLFNNVGAAINTPVDIKLEILVQGDVNQCVFYRDTYSNVDLSSTDADTEGIFSLRLGASGVAYLSSSASSFNQVFSRTSMNGDSNGDGTENGSDASCANRATPVSSARLVRISVSPAGANTYTTLSPDTILTSTPTALVADTLRGYTPDQFVGITADVTQTKLDTTYNTTNWPKLQALLNGTSADYMDSVPTAAVSFNNQRITNVAAPTAANEATNKQYVDGKIGGLNLQVTGVGLGSGGGSTLVWDQVDNRWEISDGSALTNLNATRLQSRFVSTASPTDSQVLTWNNSASQWEPRTASFTDTGMTQLTGDVLASGSGSVTTTISTGAVTSAKILDGTIATADIANSQITSAKINNTGIAVGRLLITDASTGGTVTYSTCAQDEILKFNSSTGWGCSTAASLLGNTAVTAGNYGAATSVATFSVDPQGRLTAAANVAIAFPVTSVAGRTGAVTLNWADVGGLGTAATRAVGNAVNDVVALSAANTLPALDGSNLSNLNASRLQGRVVSSASPSANNVLGWNGTTSQWEPTVPASAPVTSVSVSGPITNTGTSAAPIISINVATTTSIGAVQLATDGEATAGEVVQANDSRLSNSRAPSGSAGGSLSGTYPNPTIADSAITNQKIVSMDVSKITNASGSYFTYRPDGNACGLGEVLKWSLFNRWECATDSTLGGGVTSVSGISPIAVGGTASAPTISVAYATTSASGVVTLGINTDTVAGKVVQTNDSRLSDSRTPSGTAGGDLTGTYPNPTVANGAITSTKIFDGTIATADISDGAVTNAKIGGVSVAKITNDTAAYFTYRPNNTVCADGQVLKWGNSRWECGTDAGATGVVTSVSVVAPLVNTGTALDPIIGASIASTTSAGVVTLSTDGESTAGEVVQATDARLSNSRAPSGTAGGDLTGSYPNPTVANGTITSAKIADGTIVSGDITDGTIATADISDGAITNLKINDVAISKLTNAPGLYFGYRPNNTVCTDGEVLKWNNTYPGWACGVDQNTGTGDVTDVNAGTGITITGSTGPVVSVAVDVGTTGSKIVQLTPSAFLPAVDGNLLTNLNAVRLQGRPVATTAPANTNHILKWNGSAWESTDLSTTGIFLPLTGGTLSSGLTVTAGGIRVNGGGLNVTAGPTSLAGALTVSSGGINVTGTSSFTGGVTIASGGLNMGNGNITNLGTNISSAGSLTIQPNTGSNNVTVNSMGSGFVSLGGQSGPSLNVLNGGSASGNYITVQGTATGSAPTLRAAGNTDANVNLGIFGKGTGNVGIGTTTPSENLTVYSTSDVALGVTTTAAKSSLYLNAASEFTEMDYDAVTNTFTLGVNGLIGLAVDSSGRVAINQSSISNNAALDIAGTTAANSAIIVPRGVQSARPTGVNGMIRYNNDVGRLEGFQGGVWLTLSGTGASGGGGGSLSWPLQADAGGTVNAPSYTFNGDTDTGMWSPANGATAFSSNSVEQLRIDGSGATFQGNVMSVPHDAGSASALDFVNGTIQTTSFDCGANITLSNLNNGGSYTLVITGTGTNSCNFTATGVTTWRWVPPNGLRQPGSHTIYNIFRVGGTAYVSWTTGY